MQTEFGFHARSADAEGFDGRTSLIIELELAFGVVGNTVVTGLVAEELAT